MEDQVNNNRGLFSYRIKHPTIANPRSFSINHFDYIIDNIMSFFVFNRLDGFGGNDNALQCHSESLPGDSYSPDW